MEYRKRESNSMGYKTKRKKIYEGLFNIIKCFKVQFIVSKTVKKLNYSKSLSYFVPLRLTVQVLVSDEKRTAKKSQANINILSLVQPAKVKNIQDFCFKSCETFLSQFSNLNYFHAGLYNTCFGYCEMDTL